MERVSRGALPHQSYVPVERVSSQIRNKYEAVVVAAREARKINSVMRMVGRDDARDKVTTRALRRVSNGDVDFVYLDETPGLDEGTDVGAPDLTNNEETPAG